MNDNENPYVAKWANPMRIMPDAELWAMIATASGILDRRVGPTKVGVGLQNIRFAIVSGERGLPPVGPNPEGLRIIGEVAERNGVSAGDLIGRGRLPKVMAARREAYAVLTESGFSTTEAGELLGGRDHSTVVAGRRKHYERAA